MSLASRAMPVGALGALESRAGACSAPSGCRQRDEVFFPLAQLFPERWASALAAAGVWAPGTSSCGVFLGSCRQRNVLAVPAHLWEMFLLCGQIV